MLEGPELFTHVGVRRRGQYETVQIGVTPKAHPGLIAVP
jgi:hypothetical protein